MTHLEIINRVMIRLREPEVSSSVETKYGKFISELVVGAHEQVLDEHDWESGLATETVSIVAGTQKYALTVPVDAELQFDTGNCPEARLYDDSLDDSALPLTFLAPEDFRKRRSMDRFETNEEPMYFTIGNDGTDIFASFYPIPSESRTVELVFWKGPAELKSDGTTDSVELTIPDRPVFALALMYALNERGEEIGEPGNLAERRYLQALQSAIEKEIRPYEHANRYDWRRD